MLHPHLTTLNSGLPVLRIPMTGVASLTTLVLANTGSRYESAKHYGIAHFFEHMVFKGTAKYPQAQDLAQALDSLGAISNAFTGKEYTGYYVKSASSHHAIALDVLSDMLLAPKLRPEDINREKGVIVEEINMYEDTPMQNIDNVFEQLLFAGTQLEHDIIGLKPTVTSITQADFRQFIRQYYGLPNLLLVLAGDERVVNSDQTLQLAEQAFAKKATDRAGQARHPLDKTLETKPDQLLKVVTKKTEQAHLMLGWPGIKRTDERRHALMLLSIILGGNMSSRLFSEVREKRGLCYYVHADSEHYHDSGTFAASAGVDPTRVHEAVEVIQAECQALASGQKPVTTAELKKAKEYVAGTMLLSLEDSRSVAQFFGFRQLLMGQVITPEELLAKIQAVTLDQVMTVAGELMVAGQTRLALIGPFEQKEFSKYVV